MANTTGKKYGGRQKGTPNKINKEIREAFKNLILDNLNKLEEDLSKLPPKDRIKLVVELSKLVLPNLKPISSIDNAGEIQRVHIDWVDD